MNKIDYLVAACKAEAWRRLVWRIAVFNVAIFNEKGEPPEQYDLNYIDGLPHYWENEEIKWVPIEGCKKMKSCSCRKSSLNCVLRCTQV